MPSTGLLNPWNRHNYRYQTLEPGLQFPCGCKFPSGGFEPSQNCLGVRVEPDGGPCARQMVPPCGRHAIKGRGRLEQSAPCVLHLGLSDTRYAGQSNPDFRGEAP